MSEFLKTRFKSKEVKRLQAECQDAMDLDTKREFKKSKLPQVNRVIQLSVTKK